MEKVLVAIPSYNGPSPRPFYSFLNLAFQAGLDRADRKYSVKFLVGGPKIKTSAVRNTAVKAALATHATHLLMVDDDMVPSHDLIPRLLAHNVDIVGPLFFRGGGAQEPLVFEYQKDGTLCTMADYPKDTLFQVPAGIGTGVMMVKTEVFMAMSQPWFYYPPDDSGMDLNFCKRAIAAGFLIFCDSTFVVPQMGIPQLISGTRDVATLSEEERQTWQV
jgi:hypothetical protein